MNGHMVLAGELKFIGLADSFQILGGNNSTGILHLTSPHVSTSGRIYFVDGNPVNATSGSLRGIDAMYALFGWTEGQFEFHEEKVNVERVVHDSRMGIVLDALRLLDDGVIERVGPPSCDADSCEQSGPKEGSRDVLPTIKEPLIDYVYVIEEEEFRSGETIVTEGGHGNWIWIILEGMVRIARETSRGPITLAQLGEGSYIGGITSFMQQDYVRNATVTALCDVQLGVLDMQRLSQEYACLSSDFRELLMSLDRRLKKITDRVVRLNSRKPKTNGLTGAEKLILKQGSSRQGVFTITEGETHVMRRTPKGYVPLLTLEKDDIFGYVPFLDIGQEPRCASVMASENLKVTRLDAEGLHNEYNHLSGTLRSMINNVATCVSVTTQMACH